MTVYLGTSGWQYRHWRGRFYPRELATERWLGFFAGWLATVEVNNTFYRLPQRSVFESWREATPEDFQMAIKASRYLTHVKRLQSPAEPVRRLVERAAGLGVRLGPVLVQLPPTLECDPERLEEALGAFPPAIRVAVEFRHDSWFRDDVREILERRRVALCLADRDERVLTPLWRTADWGYVRLHGGSGTPSSCYRPAAPDEWADRLIDLWEDRADVYVYFNNDHAACALRDVGRLGRLLDERGRERTRTPDVRAG